MTTLKEKVTYIESTSHIFSAKQYPYCYVVYHGGEYWICSIHEAWEARKPYKGHKACLEICSWTTAASLLHKLPFKIRLLPHDEEHLLMSSDDIIKRYGQQ